MDPQDERRGKTPRPEKENAPRQMMRPRFIALIVALLLASWALVNLVAPPEPKVRVPYSPYFLDQVRAGNVKQINTRGEEVTGEFRTGVKYPKPDSPTAKKF